ncbi:MAG: VOC family protein [Micropruina sp.]|uniref:VOC family protein n=1 Tax=Micropruina sp. TaxID=2737536 RepID=UPI0039E276E4
MTDLFTQLHHVCIVVHDLDRAVSAYQRLGVGPWFDYPKGGAYVEYDVPNPAGSAGMRYKCYDFMNVQLQLCQPGPEDTPQRRFLDTHGEGVYHLGFEVPDLVDAVATGQQLGLDVIGKGRREDGSGFCYFDTRAEAGVTLEVRHTSAPAASDGDSH